MPVVLLHVCQLQQSLFATVWDTGLRCLQVELELETLRSSEQKVKAQKLKAIELEDFDIALACKNKLLGITESIEGAQTRISDLQAQREEKKGQLATMTGNGNDKPAPPPRPKRSNSRSPAEEEELQRQRDEAAAQLAAEVEQQKQEERAAAQRRVEEIGDQIAQLTELKSTAAVSE